MNCPNCKKILRVAEEEQLGKGLTRYNCALCKTWSRDNKRKIALWWGAMVFLFLSLAAQQVELGFSPWLQSLSITISVILLVLSHKQKQLVTDVGNS